MRSGTSVGVELGFGYKVAFSCVQYVLYIPSFLALPIILPSSRNLAIHTLVSSSRR